MKVVIQRVKEASVRVEGRIVGEIRHGLVLLVGFAKGDTEACLAPVIDKIVTMRIFANEEGRFDRDITHVRGDVLVISQFTLLADTTKGRRPEFFQALEPDKARKLFDTCVEALRAKPVGKVATGVFGAMMEVSLTNDGPVTIILDKEQ
jgi:D-tyrosyl-tRNA(Tyr) deacylase